MIERSSIRFRFFLFAVGLLMNAAILTQRLGRAVETRKLLQNCAVSIWRKVRGSNIGMIDQFRKEGETMKDFWERLHEGLVWWWDTFLGIGSLLVLAGFFIGTALRDVIKGFVRRLKYDFIVLWIYLKDGRTELK